jgi:DNA-binding response OmpR family regulator
MKQKDKAMHVLVVEDEPTIANYIKKGLEEGGYAVDLAFTGQEALDWLDCVPFDYMVLDIMLPGIDGLAVCRQARQKGLSVPILMLTARDTVDDRVDGLDSGADDYLVKPFAIKELLARLRALGRRGSEAPRTTELRCADLVLDTVTQRVSRAERPIKLTAKEYAVLECLLRSPGRVLTRTMIAEHVWSYDAETQSNVVDVYIRNLRRKIDDPFATKLIQTVRGSGYRVALEDVDAIC